MFWVNFTGYTVYCTVSAVKLILLLTLEELYSLVLQSTAFGVSAKEGSVLDFFRDYEILKSHFLSHPDSKFMSHCGTPKMCLLFLCWLQRPNNYLVLVYFGEANI